MNKADFQELKQKFAKETRKKKLNKILNFFATFLSILGVAVISYYFITNLNLDNVKDETKETLLQNLQDQNLKLKDEIRGLKSQLEVLPKDSSNYISLDNNKLMDLENKIEKLENIIMDSPEKALSIPLLSNKIENQKIINESKIELLQDKITTVIDLNKWILGLIFSLLITIVISNLLGSNQKKEAKNDEK